MDSVGEARGAGRLYATLGGGRLGPGGRGLGGRTKGQRKEGEGSPVTRHHSLPECLGT